MEMAQGAASTGFSLGGNPFNQTSPGILVMFVIFGLINSANLLVLERKSRTLERMVTTSLTRAGIIAGHLLAMFAVTFLQEAILVLFGQLVLKVEYFREPLAVLLVMTAVAVWVACMGLMIGVLARGEDRVTLIAMIFMFVLSATGGAWFPLETAGAGFAAIGKLTPGAWAMTGFQNILLRGLLPVGALLAYALAFFCLAVWKFKN
jgi:ABC-2 type transport system permease protein